MSRIWNLLEFLDDWLNPIVVKELRQAVAGRFVTAMLILFLLVQLAAIALTLVDRSYVYQGFSAGREAFTTLMVLLMLTTTVIIPIYSGVRIAGERSDTNLDLLFITTIKPGGIVKGKLFASLAVALLIYSACAPFLTFTYLLRGIDLPTIFTVLLISLFAVATNIMISLFLGCLPASAIFRYLLIPVALLFFFQNFGITMAFMQDLVRNGVGSRLGSWDFWLGGSLAVSMDVLVILALFVMTTTVLTPPQANRALPVRRIVTLGWLFMGGLVALITWTEGTVHALEAWASISTFIFSVAFLAGVSERDDPGIRVRKEIPVGGIRRILAFLFYSGSANGVIWAAMMIAGTLGFGVFFSHVVLSAPGVFGRFTSSSTMFQLIGMAMYFYAYSMSAMLLNRYLFAQRFDGSVTWVVALFLAAIGGTAGPLLGWILFQSNSYVWMIANPIMIADRTYQDGAFAFALVWCLVVTLLSVPWFSKQVQNFKPLSPTRKKVPPVVSDVLPA